MSESYYERPILFANADGFMEIGKIIGNKSVNGEQVYMVQQCTLPNKITGMKHEEFQANGHPFLSASNAVMQREWIKENMESINKEFGYDMGSNLIVAYENSAMAEADGMTPLLEDTQKCRRVLDRLVILLE